MGNLGSAPCLSPLICLLMGKSLRRFSWYTQVMANYKKTRKQKQLSSLKIPNLYLTIYIRYMYTPACGQNYSMQISQINSLIAKLSYNRRFKVTPISLLTVPTAAIYYKIKHQNASFYYTSYSQTHNSLQTWLLNSSRLFCKTTLKILTNISCLDQTYLAQTRSALESFARYCWFHSSLLRYFGDIIILFT